jgi:hypothetical protein
VVLNDWQSFYVLVGSAAAALTGLTFVVITISTERGDIDGSASVRLAGLRVFVTPTAVHFGTALWLSAVMCMPGQTPVVLEAVLMATGLAGLLYCATLLRPLLAGSLGYKPFVSDWIWNAVLPVIAYLALAAAGFIIPHRPALSLYMTGSVVLLLLFVGIHNAWDVVVWRTTERHAHRERQRNPP